MNPWQPVATAPKDKHILLARFAEINGQEIFQWAVSGVIPTAAESSNKVWVDFDYTEVEATVTHWMPLVENL